LNAIQKADPEILQAVLDVMETEQLLESGARVDILPANASFIVQIGDSAAKSSGSPPSLVSR
jgi:hypothetical protein